MDHVLEPVSVVGPEATSSTINIVLNWTSGRCLHLQEPLYDLLPFKLCSCTEERIEQSYPTVWLRTPSYHRPGSAGMDQVHPLRTSVALYCNLYELPSQRDQLTSLFSSEF